jgi:hypothetical protein
MGGVECFSASDAGECRLFVSTALILAGLSDGTSCAVALKVTRRAVSNINASRLQRR